MTIANWKVASILWSICLPWPALAQSVSPVVDPPAQSCPQMAQGSSESAARCNVHARGSNLNDGGNHLSVSTSTLAGYDSAFDGRVALPGHFEGGQVYTAATFHKGSSYTMVENTAAMINYQIAQGTLQYLNTTAISLNKSPSERTVLSLDVENSFGNDAIRLVAPADRGGVEIGSFGIHSGLVLNNQVTARFLRQSTETRWESFSVRNDFRDFFDDKSHVNTIHARGELQFQPSSRAGIGLYEETASEKGIVDCTTQSAGIVYERRFSSFLQAEVAGGPVFGSKGCITTITTNLNAYVSAQPWRSTSLYFSENTKLNDSDFAAASYEDTVQGGINQKIGLLAWMKVQGGWIKGTVPARVAPFHGEYVIGTIQRTLPRGFSLAFSAQHFIWSGVENIAPQRTLMMGLLSWSSGKHTPVDLQGPAAR
jgi:hypothetical protein